jgi:CheY-like chemotaxis protein
MPATSETRTVAILEDNPDDLFFFRRVVQQLENKPPMRGFETGEALRHYLQELLTLPEESWPYVFVIDGRLPDLTGLEALHLVRSHPALGHIPVLLVSGITNPADIRQAYDSGVTACLEKPREFTQLSNHLRKALRYARSVYQMEQVRLA